MRMSRRAGLIKPPTPPPGNFYTVYFINASGGDEEVGTMKQAAGTMVTIDIQQVVGYDYQLDSNDAVTSAVEPWESVDYESYSPNEVSFLMPNFDVNVWLITAW